MSTNAPVIRTPDQRLRVFVSSTLEELAEERAAARQAITNLRLAPVLFELGARPHPPRDLYRAYLDQSDVFVGLYWQRYGWIAPGETISGLEDEYQLSGDKPKLIYIKSPAPEREPRLKELLTRIQQDDRASYKYFTTAAELRELIENDLAVLLTERFETVPAGRAPLIQPPSRRNNLPAAPTTLIGREKQVEEVCEILRREESRLVTLTGPGGVGKSRLGLQVAADLLGDFEDGVFFVPLEPMRDPALVISAIADTLGVRETVGRPLVETLKDYLRGEHLLLVLDGFEQALSAAPRVAEILADAPKLHILVTSRAPLHLRGEREFPVLPLALPGSNRPLSTEELSHYAALQLFVQRAQDVQPDFALTAENAQAVAEICERLDGLPLALELAAARIKILSPQALLIRLDSRLTLQMGGARDLPARQQTLRNTVAWSYDLLGESDKMLFRRLAVFAGGSTLEAAEAVCHAAGDLHMDLLEGLTSLVDESLLRQGEGGSGEPRFGMLQTIREYGLERLAESGEAAATQRAHTAFFLAMAEQVESELRSGERDTGLQQAEAEHENYRAALAWNQTADKDETGLRLAGALWWFWYMGGHWSEGRGWLEGALTRTGAGSPVAMRAKALLGVGVLAAAQGDGAVALSKLQESKAQFREVDDQRGLAYALAFLGTVLKWHGDPVAGRAVLDQSVAIFRRMGEKWGLALALGFLGDALTVLGQEEEAQSQSEQSLALFRQLGDKWGVAVILDTLGNIALQRGDDEAARSRLEESVAILREMGDKSYIGLPLLGLGDVARRQGNYEQAAELYQESLALYREGGSKWGIALSLHNLGKIAFAQGDYRRAAALFEESLPLYRVAGNTPGVADCLAGLAGIAAAQGLPERAVRLFSAAQALRDSTNAVAEPADRIEAERDLAAVRAQLSEEAFAAAWAKGRAMPLEQAIAYAHGIAAEESASVRNTPG